MQKIRGVINKLSVILTRYREERFTGKLTVVFNFSQGAIGDTEIGVKHKLEV